MLITFKLLLTPVIFW